MPDEQYQNNCLSIWLGASLLPFFERSLTHEQPPCKQRSGTFELFASVPDELRIHFGKCCLDTGPTSKHLSMREALLPSGVRLLALEKISFSWHTLLLIELRR
jgi:hypothetical protein